MMWGSDEAALAESPTDLLVIGMKAALRWKTGTEFLMSSQADMSHTVLNKEQRQKIEHAEEKL